MKIKKNLTEAFNSSIPKWLKADLALDQLSTYDRAAKQLHNKNFRPHERAEKKMDIQSKYGTKLASKQYNSKGGKNNFKDWEILEKYDIDVEKMPFTSAPIPSKSTDPILTDPDNICFFYIRNDAGEEQVYIKDPSGYGDALVSIVPNKNGEYKALKYLPYPILRDYTVDFGYVDLKNIESWGKKKTDREAARVGSIDRVKDTLHSFGNYDKSGYLVDPRKYDEKLAEIGYKNLGKKYEKFHDRIVDLKNKLVDALRDSTIGELKEIGNIIYRDLVRNLIAAYNNDMMQIQQITDLSNRGEDDAAKQLAKAMMTSNWVGPKVFAQKLANFERVANKYIAEIADWEDEYEDTDEFWK